MRRLIVLSFMLLSFPAAQSQPSSQPTVKGHHLGETIGQFIASAPALRARIDYCRQHPEEARSDSDAFGDNPLGELIQQSGVTNSSCAEVLKLLNPSATAFIRQGMMEDLLAGIGQLLGAQEDEKSKAATYVLDFSGSVHFENGRVDLLELRLPTNWENSERDLYAKFGKPTRVESNTVQNSYGARNELPDVYWERTAFVAHAYENINGNQDRWVTVELVSRQFWDQLQQQKNNRPNSID